MSIVCYLRNSNTVKFLGIWKRVHNPDFNYGEFASIKIQSDLEITQMKSLVFNASIKRSGQLLDR
jgi:hypothetical protein